eukprot:3626032-Rhodomonas_salina.2
MQEDNSRYGAPFLPTQLPEAFFEHNETEESAFPEKEPLLSTADAQHADSSKILSESPQDRKSAKARKGDDSKADSSIRSRRPQASSVAHSDAKIAGSLKLAFDHPPKPTRSRPKDLALSANQGFLTMYVTSCVVSNRVQSNSARSNMTSHVFSDSSPHEQAQGSLERHWGLAAVSSAGGDVDIQGAFHP